VDLFIYRDFRLIAERHRSVFIYKRMFKREIALVVCNFIGNKVGFIVLKEYKGVLKGKVLLRNYKRGV
jgi:hypothetical protein